MKVNTKNFFRELVEILKRPEMSILPGQLAYFFVLSIFPIITLILLSLTFFNLTSETLNIFLSNIFNERISSFLIDSALVIKGSGVQYALITLVAFYISSNGARSIIVTSNTLYNIKNKSFIEIRVKSFVMIFILLNVFLFMLVVPMFGTQIINLIDYLKIGEVLTSKISFVIKLLQGPIAWLVIFFFIKLIYTMAPDKKIKSKTVNVGSLFTTVGWATLTWVYAFYINNYSNHSILYGGLANLVILLLWFYFLSLIFTIGLALNTKREEKVE